MRKHWLALAGGCFVAVLVPILLGGCASPMTSAFKLDPVGPVPGLYGGFGTPSGYLQVYTITRIVNDGGILYYPHTPYDVYSKSGKRVASCPNQAGPDDQTPLIIPLPPGEYNVYGTSEGWGLVSLPVVIVRGRLTVAYLEYGGMSKRGQTLASGVPLTRGPDGRILGCRPE